MITQFSFKNFKSYRDETIIDFKAVAGSGFKESLLFDGNKEYYLPVSVIYGPNGGGKSNALEALSCLINLITYPLLLMKGMVQKASIAVSTFKFNDFSRTEPIVFEVFFQPNNGYEYNYLLSLQKGHIVKEHLYRRKLVNNGRISKLFDRDDNGITLGAGIRNRRINTDIKEHMPFLSFLAGTYNIESVNDAASWFENVIIIDYSQPIYEAQTIWFKDEKYKQNVISFRNDTGLNITDIIFNDDNPDTVSILFEHTVDNVKYLLPINQESNGTQKLFSILPYVMNTLFGGMLLIIDELDAKLHPQLLKYIIMLFKDPEINKKKAQLFFTSHDVSTMKSSVFRTDEIWFAYKKEDESSDLYSLYELRDESGNHIGTHTAFDKQYLEGRYGADPYLRHMTDWS